MTNVFFRPDNDWTSADAESILRGSVSALDDYMTDYEDLWLAEVSTFGDETILTLAGMFAKLTEVLGGDTDNHGAKFALRERQERIDSGHCFVYGDREDYLDKSWMDLAPDTEDFL